MKPRKLKIEFSREQSDYEIVIGHDLLVRCGEWARKCIGKNSGKIVIVSNPTIFKLYGKQTKESLRDAGFEVSHFLIKDGEQYKTLRSAESALKFFTEKHLSVFIKSIESAFFPPESLFQEPRSFFEFHFVLLP